MTVIVYSQGVLYTDSYVVRACTSVNSIAQLCEKVYHSPCGRWIYTQDGSTVTSPSFAPILAFLGDALNSYYMDGVPLQTSLNAALADKTLTPELIKLGLNESFVLTKQHCFQFARLKVNDITNEPFITEGAGWVEIATLMVLGETPMQAMEYAVAHNTSCHGPIRVYKAAKLAAYKKLRLPKKV